MNSLSEPGKKIGRQFESLLHYQEDGFAYPLTAEIDLTWRCALNCKGCHSKWLHQNQELEPEDITRILMQLRLNGCGSVTWSGGGDPMESEWFYYALKEARAFEQKQGVYTYFPDPTLCRVEMIENFCEFAYTHPFNTKGLDRQNRDCVWTAGFLLDVENWHRLNRMVESVDLNFFDFVDFRPLCATNRPQTLPMDNKWIPDALELLRERYGNNPQVKWAEYKFLDLMKANAGRNYASCLSTDFVACIGPNGDMYECVNRRGFGDSILGNLLTEDLQDIWKRKTHSREDFTGCRDLCRNHELNKTLYEILGPAPKHEAFV